MENVILISVAEPTGIIQASIRSEIDPIIKVLGDKKISAKETASMLGITTRTLDRWRKDFPQLKYYTVGKSIRYSLYEVNEFKRLNNK